MVAPRAVGSALSRGSGASLELGSSAGGRAARCSAPRGLGSQISRLMRVLVRILVGGFFPLDLWKQEL